MAAPGNSVGGRRKRIGPAAWWAPGLAANDGLAGFSNFDPGSDRAEQFASNLVASGSRHLVMCHPGYVDGELATLNPVTASRKMELAFLLGPVFGAKSAGMERMATT